jgi:GNAT superfamily N-acetyltransferase
MGTIIDGHHRLVHNGQPTLLHVAQVEREAVSMPEPTLLVRTPLTDVQLNALFAAAWPHHRDTTFVPIHERSLTWISAWRTDQLVGYVNVATDGGLHAFLLDTTVHPSEQRHGLGRRLVRTAAQNAAQAGATWLHVDYEPHLDGFYRGCGFVPTAAGLMRIRVRP